MYSFKLLPLCLDRKIDPGVCLFTGEVIPVVVFLKGFNFFIGTQEGAPFWGFSPPRRGFPLQTLRRGFRSFVQRLPKKILSFFPPPNTVLLLFGTSERFVKGVPLRLVLIFSRFLFGGLYLKNLTGCIPLMTGNNPLRSIGGIAPVYAAYAGDDSLRAVIPLFLSVTL